MTRTYTKILIDPRQISKMMFLAFVIYSNVLSFSLFFVRGLSSIFLFGALVLELYSDRCRIKSERSLFSYFVFFVYIVATGILVAKDKGRMFQTAISFAETLATYYLIVSYSKNDKKVDFSINVFVLQGLVIALIMIFRGTGGARISIADEVNVNTVAVTMAFSIGFILYELIEHTKTPLVMSVSTGAILMLIYAILLTVSKKAIFGAIGLIIFWIICCYKTTFKGLKTGYKFLLIIAIFAVTYVAFVWYTTNYSSQIQYLQLRMSQIGTGISSTGRIELFKEGIRIFIDHPIFGVGFNNARYYTSLSTYTHCFYSEILACTGFFGTIIFMYGLGITWKRITSAYKPARERNTGASIRVVYMMIVFIILLFISATQIIFYANNLMYVLAILAGFNVEMQGYLET